MVGIENGNKGSKTIDFRDIPIISRVETSKPASVKLNKMAEKSAEKPFREKDKSKKAKGSNDSKFFKTRPPSGAPALANPVIVPIEIEPLSSKNRINNSKSSKVVTITNKSVSNIAVPSKKKKLSPSQEENKNMNVATHDEYEFKDSPSEPSRRRNGLKKDKKESSPSTMPVVQSVVHLSPPPSVSPPKSVQNAKKQTPPIAMTKTIQPAVTNDKAIATANSVVKKSPPKSSTRTKGISGVLSHLQPIAPKMTPIAPKCTTTNIPIFIPAPVPSLAPVQDVKSMSKGKVQQMSTTVVSLNTITVPVQIVSKSSPKGMGKQMNNSKSTKAIVSPKTKQVSPASIGERD